MNQIEYSALFFSPKFYFTTSILTQINVNIDRLENSMRSIQRQQRSKLSLWKRKLGWSRKKEKNHNIKSKHMVQQHYHKAKKDL